MKKRITISIEESVWALAQKLAWRRSDAIEKISISQVIEDAIRATTDKEILKELNGETQLDRIEKKLDNLLGPKINAKPSQISIASPVGTIEQYENGIPVKTFSIKERIKNQSELDQSRQKLERKKGESNAAWQIRKKANQ